MIREVFTTVSAEGGISPATPQYAGVQGEHNLCRVTFDVSTWEEEPFRYRGEFVDGNGGGGSTDLLEPIAEGGRQIVGFLLPEDWTAAGGRAVARLVASKVVDNVETERVYVIDVPVYFKSKQEIDSQARCDTFSGLTALLKDIHEAIDDAGTATTAAVNAASYANSEGSYAHGQGVYAEGRGDYADQQGDYAKDQGDYAKEQGDDAKDAAASAAAAASDAITATGSANNAATSATAAAAAANSAAAAASEAADAAADAADAANEAADAANEAAQGIVAALAAKADVDGTYPNLTAGNSSRLIVQDGETAYLVQLAIIGGKPVLVYDEMEE